MAVGSFFQASGIRLINRSCVAKAVQRCRVGFVVPMVLVRSTGFDPWE